MTLVNKKNIFRIVIIIWVILWVNFIGRDLFKRGYVYDYSALVRENAEGKRAYTYGKDFYEFLKFAKNVIPERASFEFVGVGDFSLESRRGIYYLYPCLKKKDPDYLLVYRVPGHKRSGFKILALLDEERFILKKQ